MHFIVICQSRAEKKLWITVGPVKQRVEDVNSGCGKYQVAR